MLPQVRPAASNSEGQPLYLKIHRNHISPGILDALKIRWSKHPADVNYILLDREPSPQEWEIVRTMQKQKQELVAQLEEEEVAQLEEEEVARLKQKQELVARLEEEEVARLKQKQELVARLEEEVVARLEKERAEVKQAMTRLEQAEHAPKRRDPAMIVNLDDQFFLGPEGARDPYTSFCVLDPCITVERHGEQLHIAARFNIETTILNYSSVKHDGHELFFHDICLQYLNHPVKEVLVMWPESDTSGSFAVTRSTNTTISGNAGLSLSQTPSGSVSLGLSRSTDLTVEYQLSTYSVSAHRVINGDPLGREKSPSLERTIKISKTTALKGPLLGSSRAPLDDKRLPRYQWFWAGTQDETKTLTPDLKHTVKRHVVVKRVVSLADFPLGTVEHILAEERELKSVSPRKWRRADQNKRGVSVRQLSDNLAWNNATSEAPEMLLVDCGGKIRPVRLNDLRMALKRYFSFHFCISIRVKRRYGRLHRVLILSGNEVKAGFLKPAYRKEFELHPGPRWIDDFLAECCRTNQVIKATITRIVGETSGKTQVVNRKKARVSIEREVDKKANNNGQEEVMSDEAEDEGAKGIEQEDGGHSEQGDVTDKETKRRGNGKEKQVEKEHNMKDEKEPKEKPSAGGGEEEGEFEFPLGETVNITAMLEDLKEKNKGKWDRLQGQALSDIFGDNILKSLYEVRSDRELRMQKKVDIQLEAKQQREWERKWNKRQREIERRPKEMWGERGFPTRERSGYIQKDLDRPTRKEEMLNWRERRNVHIITSRDD